MSSDPRQAAGAAAERQMEHYLRREFSDNDPLRIIHNLRLLDPTMTEADGSPAAAQIEPVDAMVSEASALSQLLNSGFLLICAISAIE